jgi:hypothetical protein
MPRAQFQGVIISPQVQEEQTRCFIKHVLCNAVTSMQFRTILCIGKNTYAVNGIW